MAASHGLHHPTSMSSQDDAYLGYQPSLQPTYATSDYIGRSARLGRAMAQRQAPLNATLYDPRRETNSSEARAAKTEPRPEARATTLPSAVQGKPSLFEFPEQSAPYTGAVSLKAGGEARTDEKVSSTTPTGARDTRNMLNEQRQATGNTGTTHHRNHETGPSGSVGSTTDENKDRLRTTDLRRVIAQVSLRSKRFALATRVRVRPRQTPTSLVSPAPATLVTTPVGLRPQHAANRNTCQASNR